MKAIQSIEHDVTYDKDGNKRVKTKLRLWDKARSTDQLAKHLNLYNEHQQAGAVHVVARTDERDAALREHFGGHEDEDEDDE
jgi:hypothetical protein